MKSKDIIKEASVMDEPGEKKIHRNPLDQPLFPPPKQRPPTEGDKFLASMLPGVGTAMDVKDIAGGDYSARPAVQRKADADAAAAKAAKDAEKAAKDAERVGPEKTRLKTDDDLPIVGKTPTAPRQLTPQEKAQELLKGRGFKQEPGSVSGFRPKKTSTSKTTSTEQPPKSDLPPTTSGPKFDPNKEYSTGLTVQKPFSGQPSKTSPAPKAPDKAPIANDPYAQRKVVAADLAGHAALIYYLMNMKNKRAEDGAVGTKDGVIQVSLDPSVGTGEKSGSDSSAAKGEKTKDEKSADNQSPNVITTPKPGETPTGNEKNSNNQQNVKPSSGEPEGKSDGNVSNDGKNKGKETGQNDKSEKGTSDSSSSIKGDVPTTGGDGGTSDTPSKDKKTTTSEPPKPPIQKDTGSREKDNVDFQNDKKMQKRERPDTNESVLNRLVSLSNIGTEKITESNTMSLDMKSMLQLLDEASKMADIKGKKHTGKYGKEYDTDEEGDEKSKKTEPAEKKGRGRPKKDSNVEAGKYKGADDAAKHIIGGKAPKSKSNLPSKKHTLKDWFESSEEMIAERAKNKYAIGMAAAKKQAGYGSKPATDLPKSVIKKGHEIAKKIKEGGTQIPNPNLPQKSKLPEPPGNVAPPSSTTQRKADPNMAPGSNVQPAPQPKKQDHFDRSSDEVTETLKGGQKNLDKNHNGKLDSQDFKMLRSGKKKVKEGVNFAEMMRETQMTIEEMLEGLQQEIAEFKATGSMGEKLRDALDIHRHSNKDKLMGEMSMMSQPVVEQPVEESPFTYAAKQAKASGQDSFKLGGETFPVKESEEVEESFPAYAKGNQKFGKDGMAKLRNAAQDGASERKMDQIRDKHNKYKMKEDGPGSAQLYGDSDRDFNPVRSLKQFANKGIDAWNDYEQGKKERWDAALGGNAGYIPGTLPRFDVDKDKPEGAKGKFQELPKTDFKMKPEPLPDITDREKPYRDERTGKMVYPPKGLSISEPYGKEAMKKKPVKESLEFNLWDSQLEKMLNESLTVTTTKGDHGQDDSVSITASGADAADIMALVRNAGLGGMGGAEVAHEPEAEPDQQLSAYGAPISVDVVSKDDMSSGDDMLSLIQKLTGLETDMSPEDNEEVYTVDSGEEDSHDYENEEGEEDESEKEEQGEEGSDEEDSEDEEEKVDEAYGQADEGNAFTGKLAQTQQGGEFELDGKKYKDTSSLEEGEGMCQECGMYEGECGHVREGVVHTGTIKPTGDGGEEYVPEPGYRVRATYDQGSTEKPKMGFVKSEPEMKIPQATSPQKPQDNTNENLESARPIEEELANSADDTTMQDIKYLIKTLAGGLNGEKRDQTTLPYTAVKVTESKQMINEWKKLSGIK